MDIDEEVENWYKQILELYYNKFERRDKKLQD